VPRALDYGRYYRKWHPEGERHLRQMMRYHDRTLGRFLPAAAASRILEIGSGMGFLLSLLREKGYARSAGLEVDPGQAAACRAKGLDVTLVTDTEAYLRSRPKSWDAVLALDVLEHVPVEKTEVLLAAIFAALTPGGRLIATVPNADSGLAFRWRYNDRTHAASFTDISLTALLHEAGFANIRVSGAGSFLRPRLPFLLRPAVFRWLLLRTAWGFRRLEKIAELGWREGRRMPLSLNLLAAADKPRA